MTPERKEKLEAGLEQALQQVFALNSVISAVRAGITHDFSDRAVDALLDEADKLAEILVRIAHNSWESES